jgi:hypothetical protein
MPDYAGLAAAGARLVRTKEADMAHSTLLGADVAPNHSSSRNAGLLGPSDNSDSGSDAIGTFEEHADSDAAGTGERASVDLMDGREGDDILPDRVVNLAEGKVSAPNDDELTDMEIEPPNEDDLEIEPPSED